MLFMVAVAVTRTALRGVFFNPLICFVVVWLLTFALYEFDATIGLFVVGPGTHETFLILLGLCSFVTGAVVAVLPAKRVSPGPLAVQGGTLLNLSRLTLLLLPIFALGVAWKYVTVASVYGGLLLNLPEIRAAASLGLLSFPLLSRAMTLFGYVIILNLALLLVFRPRPLLVICCVGVVLLSLVNDMTTAARGSTFNAVLLLTCGMLMATAARSQVAWRDIRISVSLFVLGLLLTTGVLYLRSDRTISFLGRLTLDGYIYLVGNVPAMAYFFDNPWPASLPLQWTFAGLYQLADMLMAPLGIQSLSPEVLATQYAPISSVGPFNSSAFLTYFHSDMGDIGVVLLSFLMGFICTYRFLVAIIRRRVLDIQIAALLMGLVIFSIKGIMTNGVMFWVTWIVVTLQDCAMRWGATATRRRVAHRATAADA